MKARAKHGPQPFGSGSLRSTIALLRQMRRRSLKASPSRLLEHARSANHREEVERASACGCFFCREEFASREITTWVDENAAGIGQTALCPRCGVDAVLPMRAGVDGTLLEELHAHWY